MEATISVIVPVYNCEDYLPKCIESILGQTYPHIQLILVNDGSTDGSGKICDAYAQKDPRVQVIHQENQGVSAARNVGLDSITGDYLLFVDGDDALSPDTIEIALAGFVCTDIGVTVFGVTKIWSDIEQAEDLPIETGIYTQEDMLYGILKDYASFGAGFPVNKLWRVANWECPDSIPRFAPELCFFEDLEWVVRMLLHVQKANLLPAHCYLYHIHSDSVTHNPDTQEWRELGYHQAIWRTIDTLKTVPAVWDWFSQRYYPEVVNGVINAWMNRRKQLRCVLLNKMEQIKGELFASRTIPLKIKVRCSLLLTLKKMHLL